MKKLLAIVLALVMLLSLAACGGDPVQSTEPEGSADETAAVSESDVTVPEGTVEVVWWTNYGASNVAYIQQIIDQFNASQDQYFVTIERQGSAGELKAKLRSTNAENLPAMFSGTPATTCFYAESDFTACFQDFVDADSEDWTADIYDVIRTSFCDTEGNMWGAPFGVSCTGLWINEDILAAAGYTTADITSFAKLCDIATDIVRGGHATYGLAFIKDGAFLNNMLALEGVDALDMDNGFSGDATKSLYNEGETLAVLTEAMEDYAELYNNNIAVPFGTDMNGEILPSFAAGNIAMFFGTNSYAGKLLGYETTMNYTFISVPGLTENALYAGVVPSGTGNYISSGASEAEQQGAYEFIKFLAKAENQSFWCQSTGYVPYTSSCADYEDYKNWSAENFPAAQGLLDAMLETDSNVKLPYTSVATDIQSANVMLFEQIYADPQGDVQGYIEEAAETVTEALEIAALSK